MPLMRGVKFGASGSKQRLSSASSKLWPRARPSQMVSVWSPFVTMRWPPMRRTAA